MDGWWGIRPRRNSHCHPRRASHAKHALRGKGIQLCVTRTMPKAYARSRAKSPRPCVDSRLGPLPLALLAQRSAGDDNDGYRSGRSLVSGAPLRISELPVLAIQAALRRVIVHRGPLDLLQRVDVARAQVEHAQPGADIGERPVAVEAHIGERIDELVGDVAGKVARRSRAEQRHDEIRSFARAPDAQGLAEILAMVGDAHARRHVEQPAQA